MMGLVMAERHLWLNLTEIMEKAFLLDAPISGSGLFGDAVNAIVDTFRTAKTLSAVSSSCHNVRASQPLPCPPGSARPQ